MNETRLCTIEQIEQFLMACTQIEFSKSGDDSERYEHISRVLKRFDYPRRTKRERGVLLRYLQLTSSYSRAQVTRLIAQWHAPTVWTSCRWPNATAHLQPPLRANTRTAISSGSSRWTKPMRMSVAQP